MKLIKSALFLLVPTVLWAAHLHRPYSFYPRNSFEIVFKADDGSQALLTGTVSGINLNDGNMHYYRIIFERGGNITLEIDGAQKGSGSMSAISNTDTITCRGVGPTSSYQLNNGTNRWVGTACTSRISIGTNVLSNKIGP